MARGTGRLTGDEGAELVEPSQNGLLVREPEADDRARVGIAGGTRPATAR